ncbi:hypothetical protein ACU686_09810 [Yinghuangia aomiensis]
MPAARRADAPIPVPDAALDPHGRGILLTVASETRLVTPNQVATASALFGLPVEGLRPRCSTPAARSPTSKTAVCRSTTT